MKTRLTRNAMALCGTLMALAGCGSPVLTPDTGHASEAGQDVVWPSDIGASDTGTPGDDTGTVSDTGTPGDDTGTVSDTGAPADAGTLQDAGVLDAPASATCTGPRMCGTGRVCGIDACGTTGQCVIAGRCNTISAPVCGCDNVTYINNCLRTQASVGLLHAGACAADAGVVPDAGMCSVLPLGCCADDSDCTGRGQTCVGRPVTSCSMPGKCKPPPTTRNGCWQDADCGRGETCEGESICACGANCILPDAEGTCRAIF